jgi:hypothetical protein
MQAGAAQLGSPDFRWPVLGVSESLRRAFSVQICNGCHVGDTDALPFRHIMRVDVPGIAARVSRSLYDPDAPSDELRPALGARGHWLRANMSPARTRPRIRDAERRGTSSDGADVAATPWP